MATHDEPDDAEHDDAGPVVVGTFATTGEAEVVQAKLRDGGVESLIDDQVEGGTIPVDGEPGVRVAVRASDAETATRLLRNA
jgi:hypothetical protein